MIERYVFVKLKDEFATNAGRDEVARISRETLPTLPYVLSAHVGTPADPGSTRSWDLSIVVRFSSIEDVEPYRVHPDHRRYVDEVLAPKMEVIKAWNFEVG